jgi:branched-chain amino acid transport system ATP-binding protein
MLRPSSGSITAEIDGAKHELTGMSTEAIVDLGVALVPEGRRLFPRLSVEENLYLGAYRSTARANLKRSYDYCCEVFPVLRERRRQLAGSMSGGEQQMLALARILRGGARLLLLDEISEGLAPVIVQSLARTIQRLRAQGYTIVMVEQNFRFAAPLADRFYIMERGQIVEGFAAAELQAKMTILHKFLGV